MVALKFILFPLLSLLLVLPLAAQGKTSKSRKIEKTRFSLEEPFRRPAKIPDAVLQLLRQQIDREHWCPEEKPDHEGGLASWFSASAVDLNDDHLPDFVVKSEKGCLTGADNDWFWVFRNEGRGYQLTLFDGAISVSLLKAKTHGFRDIKTYWNNIGTVYKFNGRVYKEQIRRRRTRKAHATDNCPRTFLLKADRLTAYERRLGGRHRP